MVLLATKMRSAGVPCGLVRTVGEAIRSAEARDHALVTQIDHPVLGKIPNLRLPIRYAATPLADPKPAPFVGQHTAEVMMSVLGMSQQQVDEISESGTFGKHGLNQ